MNVTMIKVKDGINKIRSSKASKWITVAAMTAMMSATTALTAFADDGSHGGEGAERASELSTALGESFGAIRDQVFEYIGIALPYALAIFATFFGVRQAVSFFKSLGHK